MSTIEVNKITPVSGGTAIQVGESGDTITVPSGATITNSGTANNFTSYRPNAAPLIINGDMAVAQRSSNATGLGGGSGYKSLDRYYSTFFYSSSNVGTFTQSQSTDVPTGYGFRNSFKTDCTTAQTSLPASGQIAIRYTVEAQDLNLFKFGTANAEKMTLAFWVKSNLTGTYNVSLYNQDGGSTPQVNSQYSISSANTWEKKVLVFPADTTNGFADDNGAGLSIDWIMGTGSTYTGGTAPTTWSAFVNNTFNGGSTINMASSTSNEWLITGIQLEVGEYTSSTIPPFQFERYGENLARCQRYFNMICEGSQKPIGNGLFWEAQEVFVTMPINGSTMRTTPSIYQTTGTDYFWAYRNGAADGLTELTLNAASSERVITFYVGSSQGLASDTKNRPVFFRSGQTASRLGLNAEL